MKLALIFASLLAVAFAHIEVTQQLDGSMVEIYDDIIPSRDGSGRFKRSILDGGLSFEISRERRQVQVNCVYGSYATTQYVGTRTQINCVPNIATVDCQRHGYGYNIDVNCGK